MNILTKRRFGREDCVPAARCDSGVGLKLFGFIAEPVFTFIPEFCSKSRRNAVRHHPGIAFTLLRNPYQHGNWGQRVER
jgi:hypothetical protein